MIPVDPACYCLAGCRVVVSADAVYSLPSGVQSAVFIKPVIIPVWQSIYTVCTDAAVGLGIVEITIFCHAEKSGLQNAVSVKIVAVQGFAFLERNPSRALPLGFIDVIAIAVPVQPAEFAG